jgi:3-deoxy-manno-octulosonate cytidylyltransferase (CMP-KDO synthetase)
MRVLVVIPARLASTRLPRKPLREIAGLPMLAHVYDAVRSCPLLRAEDVLVATDSDEIVTLCRERKYNVILTSDRHHSGTERVQEVASAIAADIYLNIQGDEPLTRPEHIAALVGLMAEPTVQVGTLKTPAAVEDVDNSNAVKVVTDAAGRALYFSRARIPFDRDATGQVRCFKHLGFYAYRPLALAQFCRWPESTLERAERLEQLRFLENGISIHVAETPFDTIGVDTEEDLIRAEQRLRER